MGSILEDLAKRLGDGLPVRREDDILTWENESSPFSVELEEDVLTCVYFIRNKGKNLEKLSAVYRGQGYEISYMALHGTLLVERFGFSQDSTPNRFYRQMYDLACNLPKLDLPLKVTFDDSFLSYEVEEILTNFKNRPQNTSYDAFR